jgi:CheY-like chemotaxis protein
MSGNHNYNEMGNVFMSMQAIPSFSFPTTVLMIDDNIEFLKSVAIGLPAHAATYNFYSDSKTALKLINEKYESNNIINGLINLLDEEEFEHRTIDINVRDIYRIMYNRTRFEQISTVVVDYHMPGIDGIEFCKSIKNPNIQKILLTSIVDESKAIEVLNEGLINTFIRKQSPNIMQQLNQALFAAQHRYFSHLSHIVQQVISFSPEDSALSDPAFIELFRRIFQEFGAVEYYLTEFLGSFVFLDAEGNHYGLFTRIKDQLDFYCGTKEAESAPPHAIEALKNGSQILCYHSESTCVLPNGRVWEQYLFDAIKIKGINDYFCAYGPEMLDIRKDTLLTFSEYSSPLGMRLNR